MACFIDAGTYTYTLSLIDKVNTSWEDGTTDDKVGTMIINKADGDTEEGYLIPTGLYGINGKKLSSVTLPDRFTWNSPDTIITDGMKTYTVTYTPSDTNNYNVKTDQVVTVTGIDEYSITTSVDDGNGTITNFPNKVNEWTETTVDFTPNTGYMIESVKVNGTDITSTISNNKYVFEPKQDTTIVVKYKKIPFTITVEDVTGAKVTPNGAVSVNYGDNKEFTIEVNKGYELVKVLVDSEDKTSDLVDNKLTLNNITKNMTVKVVVKEIKYEVTEGDNQKYTITKDSKARFEIDADYTLFENGGKVYVDNTLVDSANYTSESGSTIITLKKEYVDTLSKGNHTLKVEFNNGGVATANFNIATVQPVENNPKTFDGGIMMYIIMGLLSVCGLGTGIVIYRRKQTN